MPQPRQQRPPAILDPTVGQEGSRWIGQRPSPEQFTEWWNDNVFIHDGLDRGRYVGGVVLIEQSPKFKKMVETQAGHEVKDFQRLEYTPYVKVETRIAYFWDLMQAKGWLGVIEIVPPRRVQAQGLTNLHLPKGFFRHQVQSEGAGGSPKWTEYIGCSMKVTVYDPDRTRIEMWADKSTGEIHQTYIGYKLIDAPPATKLVPVLTWPDRPDDYAILKAETGAGGRALGMAGMLVIPGSGVATAEDVQEALEGRNTATETARLEAPAGTAAAAEPRPSDPPADTQDQAAGEDEATLRERLYAVALELKAASTDKFKELQDFFEEKEFGEVSRPTIDALNPMYLRGLIKRIEGMLADTRGEKASPEEGAEPKPEPTPEG